MEPLRRALEICPEFHEADRLVGNISVGAVNGSVDAGDTSGSGLLPMSGLPH